MSIIPVELCWRGPLAIPNLPAGDTTVELEGAHVYFYTQEYGASTVVYVGRANNFIWRMHQHYAYFLGFLYSLRGEDGEFVFPDQLGGRNGALNNLEEALRYSEAEARRLKFYYAHCSVERLRQVESALINRLMDVLSARPEKKIHCDNVRREQYGKRLPAISISNRPALGSEAIKPVLENLFDAAPIEWGNQ